MMKRPGLLIPLDGTTKCDMISGQLHCELYIGGQSFTLHFTEDFIHKDTINGTEHSGPMGAFIATRSGIIHGDGYTRTSEDYMSATRQEAEAALPSPAPAPAVYVVRSQSMGR